MQSNTVIELLKEEMLYSNTRASALRDARINIWARAYDIYNDTNEESIRNFLAAIDYWRCVAGKK
jgi:hypothetical protein